MKAFRHTITGRLGETQFGEDSEILIRNALKAGFTKDVIQIIDITPKEYNEEIKLQNEIDLKPIIDKEKILKNNIITKLKTIGLTDEEIQIIIK